MVVAAVGAMGLLGWVFDSESLKTFFTGAVSIKANAAICLILLGTALLLLAPEGRRDLRAIVAGRLLAGVAMLVGGLTLLEHVGGYDFGIDQFLFREATGALATASPGRMGPPASASFLLGGLALLLLEVRTRWGGAPVQWLGLAIGLIALLPLIGYAYAIQSLYGIAKYTGIAIHTAIAIAVLAIGLLTVRPTTGLMRVVCADDAGGATARRLIIPAIAIPFILGWLRTLGERAGLFDAAFGRPILVLSLIVSFTSLVWWNARAMSVLGRARARAEEDRKQREEELRASEQRYRNFISLSSEGIWRFDLDTPVATNLPVDQQVALIFRHAYLAECNDAMARMYGYETCSEITGWRLDRFLDPNDPRSVEFLAAFIANGYRLQDAESHEPDRHGNVRVFLNSFVGFVEDGKVLRAWGTQRDMTERRQAEDRARTILESITDAFFAVSRDWKFTYVNRQAERVLNRKRDELVGKVIWEVYPGLVGTEFERAYRRVVEEHVAVSVTSFYADHGKWYEVHAYPVTDGISIYFRDVTDRKRDEQALHEAAEVLRESEERFRLIADAMPQIVWVTRPDGYHEYYNRRWYEYIGLDFERTRGDQWSNPLHPDDRGRARVRWQRSLETGEPYEIEYRFRRHDGEYRWFLARALPVRGGDGAIVKWYGTCTDIHDQKLFWADRERLLASERAARAEAERASEAKSEFLATLSHELRTPLTPVLLTVSLMESHPGLPDDLREDVATIRRNIELESRLISDLLDLTRITRGKMQLDEEDVDLHLVVRSAVDICQREASAKLAVKLGASRHTVRGDATRLQQVFWNLINNAMKFTAPEGEITVRSLDAAGGRVRVEVTDTGAGIETSILPRLFDAFEQGDARTVRQQAGLGLGLTISKRIVDAHGGTITAHSEGRGRGATFAVELPVVSAPKPEVDEQHPAPATGTVRSLEVLLVEDHEPTLSILTRLLRRLGHRVTGVTTVASATQAAQQDGFDLIISDLGLPDGSGLDFIRRLPDRYAGRVIALTGYGMESDIAASKEAGFAEHLTKPVDLATLEAAMSRFGGGGRASKGLGPPNRLQSRS